MGGIAGFNWQDKKLLKEMNDSMIHRGPDGDGSLCDRDVSLGQKIHRVSGSSVFPVEYYDKVVVYDGRIYNAVKIRKVLEDKGYSFNSNSDEEVILASYSEWGKDCVKKFDGMWAFCIYDKKKEMLLLSRDRFGIKPLCYYYNEGQFVFASELKAITKAKHLHQLNAKALNLYFYHGYIETDVMIYQNCFKVKPSENLCFDLKTKTYLREQYYCLNEKISECRQIPLETRIVKIKELLINSIKEAAAATEATGAFLSGGIDSSMICAIGSEGKDQFDTFSTGFKEKSFSELTYSSMVAKKLGINHYHKCLTYDENLIKNLLKNLSEPLSDPALLATYYLSALTKEHVNAVLSGEGADEIFGGHYAYKAYRVAEYFPKFLTGAFCFFASLLPGSDKKITIFHKIKRFARNIADENVYKRHFEWMATYPDAQRKCLLNDKFIESEKILEYEKNNGLLSLQINDIRNYLAEGLLRKVDVATMLNSLEARIPYLDHRLAAMALSLPENCKIKRFKTKWLLKKIAANYLPNSIINRKKRGFSVPLAKWFKNSEFFKDYLINKKYYEHGILNPEYVNQIYQKHLNGKEDNSRELWAVFVFNYWYSLNVIK